MQIIEKIKNILKNAFTQGWTVEQLSLSFSMGIYIAFSPFPGGHTLMMFAAKWLFNINFPMLFIATSINNPWTMIPCYTMDYSLGYWLTHDIFGFNTGWYLPLAKIIGSGNICIWSFFIGGNVLGLILSVIAYPFIKVILKRFVIKVGTIK